MQKQRGIIFMFSILVITALACNLPSVAPTPPVDTAATQTSLALTQTALQNQNPSASQPEFTATITFTPTITPTLPPLIPMISVSVDTNCRTGPGVAYDFLTALLVGEKAEVVGKYTPVSPTYWIIKKGSVTCWLWGQYATVEGDTSSLPEMVPPPSPTPPPTATATATPTTPPPAAGDLHIIEIIMKTNFEVAVRVGTNPTGTLSGNYQYTVYSNGSQVQQGSCPVPTGSNLCSTGYIVGGVESIQVVIDSSNSITESNEGNNTMTVSCDKFALLCN
jgi:uncharacterized protein YgiM (DUF1202 family)